MTSSQASELPQSLTSAAAEITALTDSIGETRANTDAHIEVQSVRSSGNPIPSLSAVSMAHAVLPDVSITCGKAAGNFLQGVGQSFLYSLIQSPVEGLAQTIDHTIGASADTHLYGQVKDRIIAAPKAAAFGTAEWHGQSIGAALAIIPWFLATRSVVRAAASLAPETAALVVSEAEASAAHKLISATSGKLILESGSTAAVFNAAFKPVTAADNNYWQAKSESMASDFTTFSTLTASSITLSNGLRSATLPLLEKYPGASQIVQKGSAVLAGSLSGIPAAAVQTAAEYASSGNKDSLSFSNFAKNAYTFVFIGGSLSAGPALFAPASKMPVDGDKASSMPPNARRGAENSAGEVLQQTPKSSETAVIHVKKIPTYEDYVAGVEKLNNSPLEKFTELKLGQTDSYKFDFSPQLKPQFESAETSGQIKHDKPIYSFKATQPASANELSQDILTIVSTQSLASEMSYLPNAFEMRLLLNGRAVGKLPEPFAQTGLKPDAIFGQLDSLAKALRTLDGSSPQGKKSGAGAMDLDLKPFNIDLGTKQLTVTKIGTGEVAHVYMLSLDNCDYAFKVPTDPSRFDVHGSFFETAAFTFLSKEKINDLIDFHAANPGPTGGWMLTEYVGKSVVRDGRPLADILSQNGLVLGDDWSPNRGPGNVVWDLGGIEPKYAKHPATLSDFEDYLNTSDGWLIAARKLDSMKNQDDLKEALIKSLEMPSLQGQVARTAARQLKTPEDLAAVLDLALEKQGGAGRAAFELDRLANTSFITPLFFKALRSDEARLEAVKQIDKLPAEDRKRAFDAAFTYPDARAMAARSIYSIPDPAERQAATEKAAEYPGSSFVLHQRQSKIGALSPEQERIRQNAFAEYLDRFGLATGNNSKISGKPLSLDQWLTEQKNNPQGQWLNNGTAEAVEKIWDNLNVKQKGLPLGPLLDLAFQWKSLAPEQWRTMDAKQTVDHLSLIDKLGLDHDLSKKLFANPDLEEWFLKNPTKDRYAAVQILDNWNNFPEPFRKFDGERLYGLAYVWNRLTAAEWQSIPEPYLDDIVKTMKIPDNWIINGRELIKSPDFARWFVDNNVQEFAPPAQLHSTLKMWNTLTPDQKALPAREIVERANLMVLKNAMERKLGKDSPAIDYLLSLAKPIDSSFPQVADWLQHEINAHGDETQAQKASIEKLARDGAPAEAFTMAALHTQFNMDQYWRDNPTFQTRLNELFPDNAALEHIVNFIGPSKKINQPLFELAVEKGFTGESGEWANLKAMAKLLSALDQGITPAERLFELQKQGLNAADLAKYLEERPFETHIVKQFIAEGAPASQLNANNLLDLDELNRLSGFSKEELSKLTSLQQNGLSLMRLSYQLQDSPGDISAIRELLSVDASAKEVSDFLKLSVMPNDVSLKLVAAIKKGNITTEDLLAKLKNWHSGRQFRDLLISQVKADAPLSRARLNIIQSKAAALADGENVNTDLPLKNAPLPVYTNAETFVDAARNVEATIPADKPIVLLGRDAWPLLPILRSTGREVHYFLWSRLQYHDKATKKQWLKEIPPGAAVIDTGFGGSIIDEIRKIDPGVTGYLISSAFPERYPTLSSFLNHSRRVAMIEISPKLIYRTSKHTDNGGAVSRRGTDSQDHDTATIRREASRWHQEKYSRHLLRASGLPAWDVWRYSQWAGLTPMERLGLDNKEQLAQHYQSVAQQRSNFAQKNPGAQTSKAKDKSIAPAQELSEFALSG